MYPPNLKVHSKIVDYHINARLQQIDKNSIDWATAEAIAAMSLLDQV